MDVVKFNLGTVRRQSRNLLHYVTLAPESGWIAPRPRRLPAFFWACPVGPVLNLHGQRGAAPTPVLELYSFELAIAITTLLPFRDIAKVPRAGI